MKQRLRLGGVSPKLLQVYREDGLTLDQLVAFAINEDHSRQEQVFANLHHNREPWIIRRDMTAANVPATDRRAVFVGADAYVEAGGNVIRDLFSEDRGGFFEDAGLLDMLASERLTAQLFYSYAEAGCLEVRPTVTPLGSHADGIEDTALAARWSAAHEGWAERMPRDPTDLWGFVVALDDERRTALLAHCAARTVNALRLPWDRKPRSLLTADRLAGALALDVAKDWTPTVDSYLGRVTKAHIVEAVTEGVSEDAARRIADMKKPDMAQAAEQLLAGTGWLPAGLRTSQPEAEQPAPGKAEEGASVEQSFAAEAPDTDAEDGEAAYAVAAE